MKLVFLGYTNQNVQNIVLINNSRTTLPIHVSVRNFISKTN